MSLIENCLKSIYKHTRVLNNIDSFCLTVKDENTKLLDMNLKLDLVLEKISCINGLLSEEFSHTPMRSSCDTLCEEYIKSLKSAVSIIPLYVNSNELSLPKIFRNLA